MRCPEYDIIYHQIGSAFCSKRLLTSQFNYCPLVWMCHSRILNNRVNNIHLRALRIVHQDKKSSFEELLQKDNSVSVHMKNLQYLATEIFKVKNASLQ